MGISFAFIFDAAVHKIIQRAESGGLDSSWLGFRVSGAPRFSVQRSQKQGCRTS